MLETILAPFRANFVLTCIEVALSALILQYTNLLFFSPLSRIPGPWIRRLSSLPLLYTSYIGTEAREIARLHEKYGQIVLIAPNDVDIADSAAINPIYVEKGGFPKISQYRNYDVDGHQSIFSTLDNGYRGKRAKAVAGMFAQGRVREQCQVGGVIEKVMDEFVGFIKLAKERGMEKLDVLDLSRRLANDVLTGYLFGERYGAFDELDTQVNSKSQNAQAFSASGFVDGFVAVGRLFLLPVWLYQPLVSLLAWYYPDPQAESSEVFINSYAERIVQRYDTPESLEKASPDTYQARLLKAGIAVDETMAQCKDLIFAGTDSTSTNVATIIWNLCRQPDTLKRLYDELSQADTKSDTPLLHATVREGLRVGMANPTRLARVVPEAGWIWNGQLISPGTSVGCSSYVLHFDADTFPKPFDFNPNRWMTEDNGTRMTRMKASWFAFGAGTRQCIARNLASEEVTLAVKQVVLSRVFEGASAVGDSIEYRDWFNSHIVGGKVEIGF